MKKCLISLILSFVAFTAFAYLPSSSAMAAPKAKKTKTVKQSTNKVDVVELGKTAGKVYIFGCSFQFGDSVLYITQINEVDSISLSKKAKFLPYRSDFSNQLKEKLESGRGLKNQTSSVFFSEKKASLQKKFQSIKKRYLKKEGITIVTLNASDFKFIHPLDYYDYSGE